jgi:hypothetical protein
MALYAALPILDNVIDRLQFLETSGVDVGLAQSTLTLTERDVKWAKSILAKGVTDD